MGGSQLFGLRTALEHAHSLAVVPNWHKEHVESGCAHAFLYSIDLDQLCMLLKDSLNQGPVGAVGDPGSHDFIVWR